MNLHVRTVVFPILVCGMLFFMDSCASSKVGKTPETVAESEELLAKKEWLHLEA